MYGHCVAVQTGALRHASIPGFDLDGLMEILERKCKRVIESVVCLCQPMPDEVMRQMTIVAGSDVPMAGLLPRVVMPLHHVAIRAVHWIAAKIAGSFAIAKREQ